MKMRTLLPSFPNEDGLQKRHGNSRWSVCSNLWRVLSDRQAAESVRSRIDWKYALSLDLADPGFDYSILSRISGTVVGWFS